MDPVQQPHSMEAPPSPLSSRLERSVVERSAVSAVLSWECFSTERTRISYFATSTCAPLRRESRMQIINATGLARKSGGSVVERSAVSAVPSWKCFQQRRDGLISPVVKNGPCSATTDAGRAALPFAISTGGVMGLRPTQGDENGSCSATTVAG